MVVPSLYTLILDVIRIMCFRVLISECRGYCGIAKQRQISIEGVVDPVGRLGVLTSRTRTWVDSDGGVSGADAMGPQPYIENHCSTVHLRDKGKEKVRTREFMNQA